MLVHDPGVLGVSLRVTSELPRVTLERSVGHLGAVFRDVDFVASSEQVFANMDTVLTTNLVADG